MFMGMNKMDAVKIIYLVLGFVLGILLLSIFEVAFATFNHCSGNVL